MKRFRIVNVRLVKIKKFIMHTELHKLEFVGEDCMSIWQGFNKNI